MAEAAAQPLRSERVSEGILQKLLLAGSLMAIVASAMWIYRYEFGTPKFNVRLQQGVGQVMAGETARLVGHSGQVILITLDAHTSPELGVQVDEFEKDLKTLSGVKIKDKVVLDPGENPKYRPGSGLSAKRFLKIVRKHPGADAIVSFVGAPELSDQELAEVRSMPKFLAETHSPERLINLLQKKILLSAVVPRFEFPAPGPRKPKTGRQWFDRYFQVLTPETTLTSEDTTP
jgi:hypothetical protein